MRSLAIRRRLLRVIGPFAPRVNNLYAASTSAAKESSLRECSFAAATERKTLYGTKPISVGSTAAIIDESSDGESGGIPRAL